MSRSEECYDHPRYWDFAFSDETVFEADFIESAGAQFLPFPLHRILEAGCGGGRQVVELAKRGYEVSAFDLNENAVRFTKQRVARRHLVASISVGDMTNFVMETPVDLIHCLVNSFRHLTSESSALAFLRSSAKSLRSGGLLLLGLHLLPPDAEEYDSERWTITRGNTRVTTTLRVLDFNRKTRLETVRFSLKVTTPKRVLQLRTDHQLRIYRADQMRSLLRKVPELNLLAVFDFCYDISEPLKLNDELGDTVLVLAKR
ncbi:MAG: class I SAM-dependent methyltransferase [Planctomycetaceae bacterium]